MAASTGGLQPVADGPAHGDSAHLELLQRTMERSEVLQRGGQVQGADGDVQWNTWQLLEVEHMAWWVQPQQLRHGRRVRPSSARGQVDGEERGCRPVQATGPLDLGDDTARKLCAVVHTEGQPP